MNENSNTRAVRMKVNLQTVGLAFKFCALFGKFYLNSKNELMRCKAFCGKYNRDCASWLKNVINLLVTEIYKMNFLNSTHTPPLL